MALSTSSGSQSGAHRIRWTPEEDSVLISTWQEWVTSPNGQARAGFLAKLKELFPHRSIDSIRHRKVRLVHLGAVPRRWQRKEYKPVELTVGESMYLAAMLDGEGSISFAGTYPRVDLCNNTDEGIISYVSRLVPCSKHLRVGNKLRPDGRGIRGTKQVYVVVVHGLRQMRDVLNHILPYMHHTEKRLRGQRVIEYATSRLDAMR